jgi:seryl-tRNA synthetase
MLDPKLIKEKPEVIKNMLKARSVEFDLEGLINSDQKRREFITKTDELRKKKNQVALNISEKKKKGEDISSILAEMKSVSEQLSKLEVEQNNIEKKIFKISNVNSKSYP